jgi:hypothetical protein
LCRIHENGAYSDLKIVCGSDTYLVHKAIICPQSDFSKTACRPDTFQEGSTNIINITASQGRDKPEDTYITSEDFDWDLDVETTASVKLMIHYFYHHDYLEQETVQTDKGVLPEGLLDEHSRMYAMGEKYGISGLKAVALTKFGSRGRRFITSRSVSSATVIAFNSTPESHKRLRKEVLRLLDIYRHSWQKEVEIQKMILGMPEIAYGLYCKSVERELPSVHEILHETYEIRA